MNLARPAALLLTLAMAGTPGRAAAAAMGPRPVLDWIDDDYSKALAEARARKLPIFVESWAPW